jgi:hypothetical protein
MNVNHQDAQIVGELESQLFEFTNQGPVAAHVIIENEGVNTINYRLQEYNGLNWADLGSVGDPLYNTLTPRQRRFLTVESNYARVRAVGNASGGAVMRFSVTRVIDRQPGGPL